MKGTYRQEQTISLANVRSQTGTAQKLEEEAVKGPSHTLAAGEALSLLTSTCSNTEATATTPLALFTCLFSLCYCRVRSLVIFQAKVSISPLCR